MPFLSSYALSNSFHALHLFPSLECATPGPMQLLQRASPLLPADMSQVTSYSNYSSYTPWATSKGSKSCTSHEAMLCQCVDHMKRCTSMHWADRHIFISVSILQERQRWNRHDLCAVRLHQVLKTEFMINHENII